jgi:branched-chain amino acid transport system substrate-binding protein
MKKYHTYIIIIGIIIIALLLVFGSQPNKAQLIQEVDSMKIGIVTMTTGNLAFLGENIVNSARLAASDLEKNGIRVEFIVEDVGDIGGQGRSAIAAVQKLITVDKVQYIVDGMTSNGTIAVSSVVNTAQVPMVTPLTGGENIDLAGEYVFRNGPSDIIAGTLPAKQLTEKFGFKKVALLTDNAEYTLDIAKHFKKEFTGSIVLDERVEPDKTDYRSSIARIRSADADAILINTSTGVSARYLVKQIREQGITAPIFANFLAYGPELISVAGQYAEGVYIYDPEFRESDAAVQELLKRYKTTYGHDTPIAFHSTGTYDAVMMGVQAVQGAGYDGVKIQNYLLQNIQNWSGMNGVVSFDTNGNSGAGFVLKQIRGGELVLVR